MSVVASAVPTGTRVWLAAGTTDMRKGFTGLSAAVQNASASNPLSGRGTEPGCASLWSAYYEFA